MSLRFLRPRLPRTPSASTAKRSLHASKPARTVGTTVNQDEISHFSRLSSEWWDEQGEFSFLHRMNPTRVQFIQEKLAEIASDENKNGSIVDPRAVLQGLDVLDVGCGGGLLSESLARLGANTTGIDASEANIGIASLHASADPALRSGGNLKYLHTTTGDLLTPSPSTPTQPPKQYDVVASLEVLEHVDNPAHFLDTCCQLVKPGGHLFLSTIARTPLAYTLTILMAEHVLGKVSKGTHTWSKYVNPDELVEFFKNYPEGAPKDQKWISPDASTYLPRHQAELKGLIYNPLSGNWSLGPRNLFAAAQCNYIFWVRKPHETAS
ncbi:3-demethylubiquinone-9 3-methyltransferase [Coprinopsis cinerea okayama7|uniref:Ubiquinone biosynthesis O-methyltransferase, mitochondrial n=1 Tax=Coprinopsis cinerea (strain Okayama-7 / 130 / ATCC MYA-4618 / FGSC 9003) TaxID=240176 RepID=A8N8V4_COPC7|nr:3-demethylubiquinone-9 3-methyltransferase [Coprinopsis cinerea okayama7\|eukprot:XP_001831282.1 3-demethylubiquinone-9 3-methyltransferase [Coprinopsis cinerea okayama7\